MHARATPEAMEVDVSSDAGGEDAERTAERVRASRCAGPSGRCVFCCALYVLDCVAAACAGWSFPVSPCPGLALPCSAALSRPTHLQLLLAKFLQVLHSEDVLDRHVLVCAAARGLESMSVLQQAAC